MKYGELTLGQVEAIVNKLGGMGGVKRLLSGETVVSVANRVFKKAKRVVGNLYRLIVDYDRPFDRMIYHLGCDYNNSNITEKNFPSQESGSKEVEFVLHHPNRTIRSNEVLKEMEGQNLRPATLKELAAFGIKYPNMQRDFPIVALGSVWRDFIGRHVPFLWGVDGGRDLGLDWFGRDWGSYCRFLAVCKS